MQKKNFGIKVKMNLYILSAVALVLLFSFGYTLINTKSYSEQMAEELAVTKANDVANRTELYLSNSLKIVETIASTFVGMRESGDATPAEFSAILKHSLEKNDNILSTWVIWEPGTYNTEENIAKYTEFYETSGRFNISWFKDNGKITVDHSATDMEAEYYTVPKNTKHEVILNPYYFNYGNNNNGEEFFETTIAVPIIENDNVIGIVGLDIDLKELQEMNSKTKLYSTGYSYVVSNNYSIVAHHDESIIGKNALEILKINEDNKIAKAIKNGTDLLYHFYSDYLGKEVLSAFVPINIGETETPWTLSVIIPKEEILSTTLQALTRITIIAFISLILIALVVYFVANKILGQIIGSISFAKKIASGNLTENIKVVSNDEIGDLSIALNQMSENLNKMVNQVKVEAEGIGQTCDALKSMSNNLSDSANTQASSIEEVSTAMEEMVANIEQNSDNANHTNEESSNISNVIGSVGQSANDSLKSVEKIAEKINIINDIAFQTNILALNAAVEAARAGEHGKGFAVVAAEVRKLAEHSRQAADEISQLATGTLDATKLAANLMNELVPKIQETSNLVQEISISSLEQKAGAEQINTTVYKLNHVTQSNSNSASELAANADELTIKSNNLANLVKRFKTK